MTQKELLYFEDAIKHEENVLEIINIIIEKLESESLITFMKNQRKEHLKMKKNLIDKLGVKINE